MRRSFHDHLDFLLELLGVDIEVTHAVGLKLDHFFQFLFWYLLEISGVVAAGEGIVTAAGSGNALVEFTWSNARVYP
jgi:hypothetical protein